MAKKEEKKSISTWINLGLLVVAMVGAFLPWLVGKVSFLGMSTTVSLNLFDVEEGIFLLSKILVIVGIIAAIATIVNLFVNLKDIIKPLEKIDVAKLAPIVTFGLFACALVVALIGILTSGNSLYSYGIGYGFIIEALVVACGLTLAIKPSLLDKIIKTK